MSGDTVYANSRLRDASKETAEEEVTYSDIIIIKTAKGNQNDSEGVIYSSVSQKANCLDPAAPTDPSAPAKPDPADSSLKPYPQEESPTCRSLKCTAIVLLCVCVLLLAVAVTMGGLYIMKEEKYSGTEENLRNLKAKYMNISNEKTDLETQLSGVKEDLQILRVKHANVTFALEANISDITQALEMLQEQYDNATALRLALKANLTDTKRMLEDQKSANHNLTQENSELRTKLEAKKCAPGWEYFSGSCYYYSNDFKTWTESKHTCVAMGGHLVIIGSKEELEYISRKRTNYWIGLTQNQQPGADWYWVDNTRLTDQTFWGQGQPDDAGNIEDCAMTMKDFGGRFNDNVCHAHLLRICETKSCGG